jgi:signal recognition particle subunit SRP54
MLEQLSERMQRVMKFLRGEGKVTEKNMSEAIKMMRMALLEADVNYKVVKDFEIKIQEEALDQKVMSSLTPAQHVIKIIRDELTDILGHENKKLNYSGKHSVFMLVGLQGAGKTTTCGKLAKFVSENKKNPLLVSFDIKRPAAQEQLKMIAEGLKVPFYELSKSQMQSPKKGLKEIVDHSKENHFDPLIVDTAGRLHIDDELMDELQMVKSMLSPAELIYVGDAMTGQDAVRSAQLFEEKIGLTSIILTKLDGDARGGAALSIVAVTGKPIKFIGVGEKYDKLEIFHPERMASRILGMGDLLSLIEKAEKETDLKDAEELARKLKKQEFTLEDFKKQLVQFRKMGSFSQILNMLPKGGAFKNISKMSFDENRVVYSEAIINSMTLDERENPKIINGSRRLRIAKGSGRTIAEVNQLLKQFLEMKKMMKKSQFQKLISSFPSSR